MENINVRRAVLSDLPYLYEICLKTGNNGKDASALYNDPYMVGNYFAAPYVVYQKSICFVAEYENGPKGYIVSVPNTAAYEQWLEDYWLPPLRKQFPTDRQTKYTEKEKSILSCIHRKHFPPDPVSTLWLNDYPAHLHIDLLPVIQGKGVGKMLMNNLFDELKNQNVSGLHLGVSCLNSGAIKFYQKMGFAILKEQDGGCTMGKIVCAENP